MYFIYYLSIDDTDEQSTTDENKYYIWAKTIEQDISDEMGDEPNAYLKLPLSKQLLNDCRKIPLWSCIMRDHFGYGRVPASSSAVESEFNNLKTRLLRKKTKLRADDFLLEHLADIDGAVKIAEGQRKIQDDSFTCDELDELTSSHLERDATSQDEPSDESMSFPDEPMPSDLQHDNSNFAKTSKNLETFFHVDLHNKLIISVGIELIFVR